MSRFDIRALRGPNNEGILVAVIVVFVAVMAIVNPTFLAPETLLAIIRSSLVPTVLALGVLMVIVSGGIDVSFAAIAIFSGYATVTLCTKLGFDPGIIGIVVIAVVIGAVLGLVNGAVIARFKLPTLIVTLGTQTIFKGILLAYIGSRYIADLPASMAAFQTAGIWDPPGRGYLHVFIIPVVLLCIGVWLLLRSTMFGRGLYAIGGDAESARRVGFPVVRTQILLYVLVGVIAAIGGLMHIILNRSANPQDLVGNELDVIAAVVLGGASIFGGRGSVLGTILGVVLVQLINNSLLLLGVPGSWQRAAVGLMLVVGVTIQALSARRTARKTPLAAEVANV
ncbi:ABC transporter permease [Microbacterium lacticum]